MCKINKPIKIIIISMLVLITGIYLCMFYRVNKKFPQNNRVLYSFGEVFINQGAEFKVTNTELLSKKDILKDKELVETLENNSGFLTEEDLNIMIIDINIKNNSEEKLNIDLTSFHLESGSFSLQFYYPLVLFYNKDSGMYLELEKGEEKNIKMPVPISEINFLNYDINNIKTRDYFLVFSLYSEKKMAEIKYN